MVPRFIVAVVLVLFIGKKNSLAAESSSSLPPPSDDHNYYKNNLKTMLVKKLDNDTVYRISKQLCWNCISQSIEFLLRHNLVRATKWETPLTWDSELEKYAKWWAGKRQAAGCEAMHSFPEGEFKLGENIFWGSGGWRQGESAEYWTASDAVKAWADEEKFYDYKSNSCTIGEQCGHYTQIVWKDTKRVGCARVMCNNGDVFITCNYYPPGNYVGQRPY